MTFGGIKDDAEQEFILWSDAERPKLGYGEDVSASACPASWGPFLFSSCIFAVSDALLRDEGARLSFLAVLRWLPSKSSSGPSMLRVRVRAALRFVSCCCTSVRALHSLNYDYTTPILVLSVCLAATTALPLGNVGQRRTHLRKWCYLYTYTGGMFTRKEYSGTLWTQVETIARISW